MTDRQLLEQILSEQKALTEKVGNLEKGQQTLQQDVLGLKQGQQTLEQGVGALSVAIQKLDAKMEQKLDDQLESLKGLIGEAYDLHGERITALEEEVGIKPRKH